MQTIYLKSPMKEKFKKYIKKEEYNPDINKTEIWIGNFSSDPTIDPIDIICKIIPHFQNQDNKIIINDFLQYNNKKNWKIPLIFKNITFNKDLQFIFNSFDYKVKFIICIFMKNVLFGSCHFEENVEFAGCVFSQNTDFTCSVFNQKSNFLSTKFEGLKNDFSKIHFNKDTSFENIKVKSDINFSDSIFEENVCFENAAFEGNIRFHESIFEETANFTNTKFQKLVDFYLAKFHKAQQFHLTDFLDRAIFSNTIFYREAQFLYNKVENNSYINFESAIFKRGLDISRSNFNCNLNFWNTTIEEDGEEYVFESIDNIKYKNDFEAHDEAPSVYKQLRETYRIIKDNSYKQNSKIEALEFSKREMLVYEKELKSLSADKILLLANKFSNNYGTNWVKGLLFTMLSGFITYSTILYIEEKVNSTYSILLICFLFVVIMSKTENIKEIQQKVSFVFFCCLYVTILCFCNTPFAINWELFIEHYLKVLNVIDLKPFEKEENSIFNLSGLSYLFLFIGRIFIGYGYYQTIQAFRKFGKS